MCQFVSTKEEKSLHIFEILDILFQATRKTWLYSEWKSTYYLLEQKPDHSFIFIPNSGWILLKLKNKLDSYTIDRLMHIIYQTRDSVFNNLTICMVTGFYSSLTTALVKD